MSTLITLGAQSVTLEDSINSAVTADPKLRSTKFNLLATEENIAIARARLLPQAFLQGSSSQITQTTSQDSTYGGSSSRSFTGPSINHQLVIRQAIMRPKELSTMRYAELQTQYMELKYKSDLNDLRNRVINAWFDLLGAQQISQAYEKPLSLMRSAAMQERTKYERGDSTKEIAMEAEAQYENSKALLIQAFETLKAKQSAFESLVKLPASELGEKKESIFLFTVFSDADKPSIWENLKSSSLEIKMAKLQEYMQLERIKMAETEHKPTLDLLATFTLAQNDATSTQGYQYKNKQLGLQYTLPLISGGGASSAARQAAFVYEASLLDTAELLTKLQTEFDIAWSENRIAILRQNSQAIALNAADEQISAAKRSFELGVKSISEVANAESLRAKRRVELIQSENDYIKSLIKMRHEKIILKHNSLYGYEK